MFTSIRTVAAPLLATFLLLLGVGLLNTLIPLRGETIGFSVAILGTLSAAYYAGFFAGTILLPTLIHRIGHIRAFGFCTALVAIFVLLQAMGSSYLLWLFLRFAQGLVLVGLYAMLESWLNVSAPPNHRTSVFAIYMMLSLSAQAGGQQFLNIQGEPFVLFALAAILFCAAALPISVTRQKQPEIQGVAKIRVWYLYRLVPTALFSALLSGLTMGALWGLLPIYARSLNLDDAGIGTYMSVTILGGFALQWPLGRLADRIDRRLALAIVAAIATLAAVISLLVPVGHPGLAMGLAFLFGGACFTIYPIAVAHLVDYLPHSELLSASSTILLVYGAGSAVGPLLAGSLMHLYDARLLFAWFAGLHIVLAAYALYRYSTRERVVTTTDQFVPMTRSTPEALSMHMDTDAS